jgi:hypothetical protein
VLAAPSLGWAGITPTPFRTGLFGITPGQAIRVSVLNAGNDGGIINPCMNPDLAGFVVKISGLAGQVLFESRGKAVPEGRGAFADFVAIADDGAASRGRRAQVRAEVSVELQPILEDGSCEDEDLVRRLTRRLLRNVHLTLEVFDVASGRTVYTLPFAEVAGIDPTPFITGAGAGR